MASVNPKPRPSKSRAQNTTQTAQNAAGPSSTDAIPPLNSPSATRNVPTSNIKPLRSSKPDPRAAGQRITGGLSSGYFGPPPGVYFRSRRVKKGEVERPWLEKKDPREKWNTILPVAGLVLGLIVSAILIWDGMRKVAVHNYCEVFSDNFSTWNASVWTKEVEVGGYG